MKPRRMVIAIAAITILTLSSVRAAPHPEISSNASRHTTTAGSEPQAPSASIAIESYVRAAEAGDAQAMNFLGVLYSEGTKVERDYSSALYWYLKAANHGSTRAMNNIGTMFLYGLGVSRDDANAAAWFGWSAALGNPRGMYSFAAMAAEGMGIARNRQLANAMYRRAAEAGFVPAMLEISASYAAGRGARRDLLLAYAWLEVALRAGVPDDLRSAALARLDQLGARLGEERRSNAQLLAAHLAAVIKARALHGVGPVSGVAITYQ